MTTKFEHLTAVSDAQDFEFVKSQSLGWVRAIEAEIKAGKTPDDIRDWWTEEYQRPEMALRIYHAARHIYNEVRK